MEGDRNELLRAPSGQAYHTLTRTAAPYHSYTDFNLAKGDLKHYQQQYGDMYFLRLARLKPALEALAAEVWEGYQIGGDTVHRVERVLDVRQGELCWVVGTVYMDMPLKPSILDDISRDHWIAAPPAREKYVSPDGQDKVMLEDESGRLRLIGAALGSGLLVTGCIIAVMGTENANGDFEVIDLKIPNLPRFPARSGNVQSHTGKVALVSGFDITGQSGNTLAIDLLTEWLLGESASPEDQAKAASVSRLVIAGNSLAEANPMQSNDDLDSSNKRTAVAKKYGYDSSAYNPAPPTQLDLLLSTILPSLPVTLLPGASDPANVSLPQQPLHPALFPQSRSYAAPPDTAAPVQEHPAFHPSTNPCAFALHDLRFLGTSGQNISDIAKYIPMTEPTPTSSEILDLMEHTLRWRIIAPTAPDTLWCYPYQQADPFVLDEGQCPHVYFVGNMPAFAAGWAVREIDGGDGNETMDGTADENVAANSQAKQSRGSVRLVAVPRFSETGQIVLVDLETLDVEVVEFGVFHENGAG